MTGRPVTQH